MQGIVGLTHVAIKVADLDRTLDFYVNKLGFAEMLRLHKDDGDVWLVYLRITDDQFLEAAGIPLLLPLKRALDGNWQAWIEDPDGNRIELMQMDPDSLQLKAIERLRSQAAGA